MNNDHEDEFIESSMLGNDSHNYIIHRDDMDDDGIELFVGDGENSNPLGDPDYKGDQPLREQDRFLPIANIAKIMKRAIPESGKIAKDARECVQECVSEFVSFITSEASERCQLEKRKTINGEDLLFSMTSLGFDSYIEPLKLYLQKYREATKGDKSAITGMYEEVVDENFSNQNINEGMIQEPQRQTEVIYTYTDQLQQFNLV